MSGSMSAPLDVEVVSSTAELEALGPDWNGLLDECARADGSARQPAMSDHRWTLAWWRHFGATARQRTWVLKRGARRVGILPLALTRGFEQFPLRDPYVTGPHDYRYLPDLRAQRLVPLRRLSFPLGIASGNVRGAAILPQNADELLRRAARHAAGTGGEWDVLVWPGLRTGAQTDPKGSAPSGDGGSPGEDGRLARVARDAALRVGTRRSRRSLLRIELQGTFDDFLRERSKKFRKDVRQESNRLARTFARLGAMTVRAHRGVDAGPALETMFELERQSWKVREDKRRRLHLGLDDTTRAFFREVTARFAATDQVQVTILRFGDTPAAGLLSIERAGITALILTYRNERLGEPVAMTPLWSEFVRLAIGHGTRSIDVNGYTRNYLKWAKQADEYARVLLYNRNPYSRLLFGLDEAALALKRRLDAREASSPGRIEPDAGIGPPDHPPTVTDLGGARAAPRTAPRAAPRTAPRTANPVGSRPA